MVNPEELLYSETHEWVRIEESGGQKTAVIGISAFAVEQLTDLVYMELPAVGGAVTAQQEFGEVESVKAVSPLFSPVSGTIVAVNDSLPDNLDVLSQDPYGEGWLIKVQLSDEASLAGLMDHAAYQKQCAEEEA